MSKQAPKLPKGPGDEKVLVLPAGNIYPEERRLFVLSRGWLLFFWFIGLFHFGLENGQLGCGYKIGEGHQQGC